MSQAEHPAVHKLTLGERLKLELAWLDNFIKLWLLRLMIIGTHLAIIVAGCYLVVWALARKQCYSSIDEVPVKYAGLVLGCVKMIGSDENAFFNARVNAATELFKAGKVQFLLVSGDNHKNGSNEPQDMKAALIAKGVPADHIYCDYAGFRTLDSVVRARKIFGQRDFTIISQRFHNERAVYMARRLGTPDSVAFDAADASPDWMFKMYFREIAARVMAVLDVEVLNTEPRTLGEKVSIGPKTPPVDAP
ncbi:MAG TPA: ElyC/SanA/YdcF family protein [Verrucomicrobium sp.]|nr:ElyC/SanA/YdcF family protein [Verrucomicrobium sp.]